jgi:hypothetical protein
VIRSFRLVRRKSEDPRRIDETFHH